MINTTYSKDTSQPVAKSTNWKILLKTSFIAANSEPY